MVWVVGQVKGWEGDGVNWSWTVCGSPPHRPSHSPATSRITAVTVPSRTLSSPLFACAADKNSRLFAEILPWLLLLLAVIIVGGVVIFIARRYVQKNETSHGAGFTLHDLREMHAAGEINDDEFERAKAQMIGRLKAASARAEAKAASDDARSTGNHDDSAD